MSAMDEAVKGGHFAFDRFCPLRRRPFCRTFKPGFENGALVSGPPNIPIKITEANMKTAAKSILMVAALSAILGASIRTSKGPGMACCTHGQAMACCTHNPGMACCK